MTVHELEQLELRLRVGRASCPCHVEGQQTQLVSRYIAAIFCHCARPLDDRPIVEIAEPISVDLSNMTPTTVVMLAPSNLPSTTRRPRRPKSMDSEALCAAPIGIGIPRSLFGLRHHNQRAPKRNAVVLSTHCREMIGLALWFSRKPLKNQPNSALNLGTKSLL